VLLSLFLGTACGYLQVGLGDLSTTALSVTVAAMALGCAWPRHPWRWALLVELGVPAAVLLTWDRHPGRGMLFGSFAILAPALVAAFGGSFMRKLVTELFRQ
jgi:hypothetical protein